MTLAPGTRLGPYEILAPLGAGGMGEVYRATDTRLGRVVAIKVLPAHLADDPARRERFEREARAVSALNHPHICTLHDIGAQEIGGRRVDYLVMEHLEGEPLSDRLAKGPLPSEQVLRHGIAIADALDRAHRRGIVHRDLKPGNIMLTRSGAKLLDFGLAKLIESGGASGAAGRPAGGSGAGASGSVLATTTRNLTAEGAIVGTFQYMAPEQLEGKETDARTDIFAFGAVLYEMATGRRAFEGQSQASLIASILKEQPRPIAEAQPLAPRGLDRVVRACLAKNPDDRIQSGHDVRLQLEWVLEGAAPEAAAVTTGGRPAATGAAAPGARASGAGVWQAAVAVLLVATGVLAYLHFGPAPAAPERPALHFTIAQPPKVYWRPWNSMALSPDGLKLVFYADSEEGGRLFLRTLSDVAIRALPGTDQGNASFPFWSPDSRSVAFFAGGMMKRIDIAGGPPTTICEVSDGRGGAWAPDGTIVFSPSVGSPLMRVAASGGKPEPATDYDAQKDPGGHLWPGMLPDGRHFTFIASGAVRSESSLMLGELGSHAVRRLWVAESGAQFAPPGDLLFMRGNTLFAQPFDTGALAARGDAVPIVEGVSRNTDSLFAAFSASGEGTLVYKTGSDLERQMGLFDRNGRSLGRTGPLGDIGDPELSPDGTLLAVDRVEPNALNSDIWVIDMKRGTSSRFTFDPDIERSPAWSPDGQTIYYVARRKDRLGLYAKPANGGASERLVVEGDGTPWTSSQVTRDGAWFVFARGTNSGDIWIAPMKGGAAPHPYMETPYSEMRPQVSPDNRWIAYESDESGRSEVYVQTFPHPGGKWQVSTSGGVQPRWRADMRELYYFALDRTLMAVPLRETGDGITPGAPTPVLVTGLAIIGKYRYTASPDGQRFYLAEGGDNATAGPFDVILNWPAMLRGR
jgi:eukaryotic-like serine/threonine-protein kinase